MKRIFKKHKLIISSALFITISLNVFGIDKGTNIVNDNFENADKQLRFALQEINNKRSELKKAPNELVAPRNIQPNGSLRLVPAKDWCSGFFAGELWYLYEYTKDNYWKQKADEYTSLLEPVKSYKGTHDLGFIINCSAGNGYRLTSSPRYKEIIIESAKSLSSRFNPRVGCIRSWDCSEPKWLHPVIIDNMMNLEMLFEATKLSGDSSYYKIAVSHANTTMKNHFRKDYSSFHVIDNDPYTGLVRKKNTAQGYSDSSAWARGQAWGLYGYTMCYRETGDKKYLTHAQNIAKFIFTNPNLPADMIPYWDYNDPAIPSTPRDVSAAAVMASALYELSTYSDQSLGYKEKADVIVESIANHYRVPFKEMHGFLTYSSTGHKPAGTEINVPIVYADYYFLEALTRKNKLANNLNPLK